jgi:hypothetical protein
METGIPTSAASTATVVASSTPTGSPIIDGGGNNTTAFVAGGAGVAAVAAAAGVFFVKRGSTAKAQFTEMDNAGAVMNPIYEGIRTFDNPLYDGNDMDAGLDDGFEKDAVDPIPKA